MPDENEPVTTTPLPLNALLPIERQGFVAPARMLLGLLLLVHLAVPHLFIWSPGNHLLVDSLMPVQLTLLAIMLALGGLNWLGVGLITATGLAINLTWMLVYPPHMYRYALLWFVVPLAVVALTLIALRLLGFRGNWQNDALEPVQPWQISIRWLMGVTVAAALLLAFGKWIRNTGVDDDDWWSYLITVTADGTNASLLTITVVWATGTRGAAFLKFLILLAVAFLLAVWQVFSYRMEDFWHLSALMSAAGLLATAGTLYICRVCGWQVIQVSHKNTLQEALQWSLAKLRRLN